MLYRAWIQVWEVRAGLLYQLILATITHITSNLCGLNIIEVHFLFMEC